METRQSIRRYILDEHLPNEPETSLRDDMPLLTTGIIDSIGIIKLIGFIESEFGIEIEPLEAIGENFQTVDAISRFVARKRDALATAKPSSP